MSYKELVPKKFNIGGCTKAGELEVRGYNQAIDDFQPLIEYVEKLEADLEHEKRRADDLHGRRIYELEAKVERLEGRLNIVNSTLESFIDQYHLGKDTGAVMALRAVIKYNKKALEGE